MTTVCIIGAGDLGGAAAHAIARVGSAARVVLIDENGSLAAGKALDIQQSGAIEGFHTALTGTADIGRAAGADVCVIADRAGRSSAEWQDDDGLALLTRLGNTGRAPLVFAGARQASLIRIAALELGIPRERLIGSATEAFASAATAVTAMEARCSPGEIRLAVLGAPPAGLVVPWGDASIGGCALERVLTTVQLTRLEARLARLWPPGPHALGAAAARVACAILTSSRRAFSILSVLAGEFGVRGRVGTLPALFSPAGIAAVRVPTLDTRERVRIETALG